MKQWIAIAMVAAFAAGATAQTAAPGTGSSKERQDAVKSATTKASTEDSGAATAAQQAANVKASKQVTKMTTEEKNAYARELNKQMINPENPSGSVAGTAEQQKANVAVSKGQPKQTQKINTLGPKSEMQKAATH